MFVVLLGILVMLMAVGSAAAADDDTIYFGLPAQLTGADTYIHGELLVDVAQLAVDEINEAGGILGKKVALKTMDDAGDPKQGVNVANSFCDDPSVVAVLGHPYSGVTIAALPIYEKCNMPVATHGSSPVITELGYKNIIANSPNDFIASFATADFAKNDGRLCRQIDIKSLTLLLLGGDIDGIVRDIVKAAELLVVRA